MKKLIPTLLPILGVAISAISPQVQALISHFVSSHPAWASLLTAVSLIINHWLPSPGSDSTAAQSVSAKTLTTLVLCCGLSLLMVSLVGCTPVEVQGYRAIVGAKAFTLSISKTHPECGTRDANGRWVSADKLDADGDPDYTCQALDKAIAAKDTLIDLAETYCSGPDFESGGHCNPPTDKTQKDQLGEKLKGALDMYAQTEADLTTLLK